MNQIDRLIGQAKTRLAKLEEGFQEERTKLLFHIEILEKERAATPVSPRRGKRKNVISVLQYAMKALEKFPQGLNVASLVAEMERNGWKSESSNKPNIVNTQLHLAMKKGEPVHRTEDGCWTLVKRVPKLRPLTATTEAAKAPSNEEGKAGEATVH